MASSTPLPDRLVPLLEAPNYGVLGTVRPDGAVQVNPMWFEYDGESIRFTHTTKRAKYRNLRLNPAMSLAVMDPADPLRYVEVRGRLVEAVPDPQAEFFLHLAHRYGQADAVSPADAADRVVLVMSIEHWTAQLPDES